MYCWRWDVISETFSFLRMHMTIGSGIMYLKIGPVWIWSMFPKIGSKRDKIGFGKCNGRLHLCGSKIGSRWII